MSQPHLTATQVADETGAPNPIQTVSASYLLVVAVLLIVIIGTMGVLWYRERGLRIDLQSQILQARTDNVNLNNQIVNIEFKLGLQQQMMKSAATNMRLDPLNRDELTLVQVHVDGKNRQAYEISPATAERIGRFKAGDIIVVKDEMPAD